MTEIGFYHLTRATLEQALPQLLMKTLDAGKRALVVLGSDERVRDIDNVLWSFDSDAWLPHGSARDGDAIQHPVWLTVDDDNPNGAEYLFLADGAASAKVEAFERCFELFDGHDDDAVQAARGRWKTYTEAGHTLAYWQQGERGWEKKA